MNANVGSCTLPYGYIGDTSGYVECEAQLSFTGEVVASAVIFAYYTVPTTLNGGKGSLTVGDIWGVLTDTLELWIPPSQVPHRVRCSH